RGPSPEASGEGERGSAAGAAAESSALPGREGDRICRARAPPRTSASPRASEAREAEGRMIRAGVGASWPGSVPSCEGAGAGGGGAGGGGGGCGGLARGGEALDPLGRRERPGRGEGAKSTHELGDIARALTRSLGEAAGDGAGDRLGRARQRVEQPGGRGG